jgi:hypothetical protein
VAVKGVDESPKGLVARAEWYADRVSVSITHQGREHNLWFENHALRTQASRMVREVARRLGKSLIEVEANISPFPRRLVGWDQYHGAAMASVALLFQQRFRKVLVASSYTHAELVPWGSHPLLDPFCGARS